VLRIELSNVNKRVYTFNVGTLESEHKNAIFVWTVKRDVD